MKLKEDSRSLVLFTIEFPFGTAETFLETEIKYLAAQFEQVFIIPSQKVGGEARGVPSNVEVLEGLKKSDNKKTLLGLVRIILPTLTIYFYSLLFSHHRKSYVKYYKSLLHHLINDLSRLKEIQKIIKDKKLQKALFYDYWFSNVLISLSILKRKKLISTLVCRTHRYDLYDDINFEQVVPFKQFKLKHVDKVFAISEHGLKYLANQTNRKILDLSYLGVEKPIKIPVRQKSKVIVSCSSMVGFKQVDKIAEVIRNLKSDVLWVHFGDGPLMSKVKSISHTLPKNITVDLKGFVKNKQLTEFYEDNYVDLFISLSTSEGLPVSMMEAQSFGIPIIAPSINGIPELVNSNTGVLLNQDLEVVAISKIVDDVLMDKLIFDRVYIRQFFSEKFNASLNYSNFAKDLFKFSKQHGS